MTPGSSIPSRAPANDDEPARGTLRILIADDSQDDYELVVRALRAAGFHIISVRVDGAADMTLQLQSRSWDLVLSDWSMPGFGAAEAIEVLHATGLDLPFIIVSGTVGEETAVEAMRFGAHDFLLKDRLSRLIPAIERELRDARLRRERRGMQEQLLISDRMASVGLLAAGVAHEINNPLAAVLANLDLACEDANRIAEHQRIAAPGMPDLIEELGDARTAAMRIRDIVRDLKLFSRPEDEKIAAVDVGRALESSLRMATNEIRHRARLVRDLAPVPAVEANESRLGQVFLNLLINAAQAIPEGNASGNEIRVATYVGDDGRVIVEITDTGSGIPPDVQKRLFTPFFTTKQFGVGTGLGLSICNRIVTGLGGTITVDSAVGQGSTFRVLMPPAPFRLSATIPIPPAAEDKRRGRIMIIDDEEAVVRAASRILSDHEIVPMTEARGALALIAAGQRFDVILCDLMMPEMTGMELHAELIQLAPDQANAMVFVTGGAFTAGARGFLDQVKNERFEKPFNATQLRGLVRDLLGG